MNGVNRQHEETNDNQSDHAIMAEVRTVSWKAAIFVLSAICGSFIAWAVWVSVSIWTINGNCSVVQSRIAHIESEGDSNGALLSQLRERSAARPTGAEVWAAFRDIEAIKQYIRSDSEAMKDLRYDIKSGTPPSDQETKSRKEKSYEPSPVFRPYNQPRW